MFMHTKQIINIKKNKNGISLLARCMRNVFKIRLLGVIILFYCVWAIFAC
jgi:hypothetical protein